ncbi:MAG: PAS domain-containing protein [Pseudomonadota bacterium]
MAATIEDARPLSVSGEAPDSEQRAQLLGLAEQLAGVGHWLIDLTQDTLFWSDEIFRIHGVKPETYTPDLESAIAFYHPDDVDQVRDAVETAIVEKRSFQFECRIVRPNGEIRTVQSKSVVQTDDEGNAASVFGIFQDVTERRITEDRLRLVNDRYQLAIKGAQYGLWDWDIRANAMYWAPRDSRLDTGDAAASQDLLTELKRTLHPRDRDRVIKEIEAHLKKRLPGPYDTEYRVKQPDGSYAWVHVIGQATWDANGEPLRMAGSSIDITDRKNDERVRENLYRLLSDADMSAQEHIVEMLGIAREHLKMDLAMVSRVEGECIHVEHVDAESRFAAVEPGDERRLAETICARTRNEDRLLAVHGDSLGDAFATLADASDPTMHYIGIPLYVHGNRYGTLSFRSFGYSAKPLQYRRNAFVTMLAQWIAYELAQHETTEQLVQSAQALAERERELDAIFNAVPVRIWFKDDKNRILRLNAKAADSMGVTIEAAEGADTYALFPDMAEKYHRDDLSVIESGVPLLNVVEEYTPVAGKRGWVRTDKIPFSTPESGERRVVVAATDITELMDVQTALERQTELLLKSNQDLDDFAYIASHDLRAPMRGIEQLAEWIEEDLEDKMDDETRENLKLMRNRIARLNRMLTDILSYSRAGKEAAKLDRVDLNDVCREVVEWIEGTDRIKVDIGGELPVLHAPRTTVQQIFQNLISNAVKHHDGEVGKVSISVEAGSAEFLFTISDDGPGIPAKFRERVFRMFETLNRRDEVESSGIGLAVVKRLVNSLGGSIRIADTRTVRGCTIEFTLPRSLEEELQREDADA